MLGIEALSYVFPICQVELFFPPKIASLFPGHLGVGAVNDQNILDGWALIVSQCFINGWLQQAGLALAVTTVCGDNQLGLGILDTRG